MENTLLKDKKINYNKLIEYGFIEKDNKYLFSTNLFNNQFMLSIEITYQQIKTKLIEKETQEEYILHLTDAVGDFVGKIRAD